MSIYHAPSGSAPPWSSRTGVVGSACSTSSMRSGPTARPLSSTSGRPATTGPRRTSPRPLSAMRWRTDVRGAVAVVFALARAGCSDAASSAPGAPPPRAVSPPAEPGLIVLLPDSPQLHQIRVAAVEAADVPNGEVVAPARVGIDPSRLAKVLLPVPGRIDEVLAKLGDRVERGQALVAVESPDADGAVSAWRQSEAAERQAAAAVTKAEADYVRVRDLLEHGAAAQKDVLDAQNDRAPAHAAREQARRKLELLGLAPTISRQRVLVRAPINGTVLEVGVAPGEYRNDTATPLMSIADLTRVWLGADVAEPAIALIRPDEQV